MGEMMTSAAEILACLESCRADVMMRMVALDARRVEVAFAVCVKNSVTAKQRWREMNDEAAELVERITLFDFAIQEARQRALRPDWRQQFQEITGVSVA
jgi:hypothetical protein